MIVEDRLGSIQARFPEMSKTCSKLEFLIETYPAGKFTLPEFLDELGLEPSKETARFLAAVQSDSLVERRLTILPEMEGEFFSVTDLPERFVDRITGETRPLRSTDIVIYYRMCDV